jgi:hypothetical protein
LLVAGAFVVLALTAARQLVWLGPIAFYLLRRIGRPGEIAVSRRWSLPAVGVGLVALAGWAVGSGAPPPEGKLLAPLAERIAAEPVTGRVAVPTGSGSYLLWIAPGQRITVDGRYELYRPELEAALDLLAGRRLALLGTWGVAAVITRNPLGAERLSRAGFRVVASDENGYLLRRDRLTAP